MTLMCSAFVRMRSTRVSTELILAPFADVFFYSRVQHSWAGSTEPSFPLTDCQEKSQRVKINDFSRLSETDATRQGVISSPSCSPPRPVSSSSPSCVAPFVSLSARLAVVQSARRDEGCSLSPLLSPPSTPTAPHTPHHGCHGRWRVFGK